MRALREEIDRLKHYQRMLKQPEAEFEVTEEVNNELSMKARLWSSLKVRIAPASAYSSPTQVDANFDCGASRHTCCSLSLVCVRV
jgi:hypothetical protein